MASRLSIRGVTSGTVNAAKKLIIAGASLDAGLAVGDIVKKDTGASQYVLVTSNTAAHIPTGVFGIVDTVTTPGVGDILLFGIKGGYTGFVEGDALYVQTDGTVGNTVPVTGIVQNIGTAISTTEIFFNKVSINRRVS